MVGDDGKTIIHYTVLDKNKTIINPGESVFVYPEVGMEFSLEVYEDEAKKHPPDIIRTFWFSQSEETADG